MKSGKLNKMATTLAVLFLVMSGLMVVQWNAQPVEATEHEDYSYTIEGFIDPIEYIPIESDLEIKLRSLSTGETWNEYTSEDYYEFTDVKPGWYEIILPSQIEDDIAYMRTNDTIEISDENVIKDFDVDNEVIDHTLQFNVTTEDDPVEEVDDVTITLQNRTKGFFHDDFEVVCEENATFEIDVYSEFTGSLMVEKENYSPNFTYKIELDEDEKTVLENITLDETPVLEGRLVDQEGSGIREEMSITLYNEDVGILQRTKVGPKFIIRAPIDYDYTLVVDAPGYRPLVNDSISFDEDNRSIQLGRSPVKESEPEKFHTDIRFDYDAETEEDALTVETDRSIRAGTRMETLDYSSIGNLAMQIDLAALGDGDGYLDEAEIEIFKERLNYTKNITYTPEFITVNETVFELKSYEADFSDNFTEKLEGNINASNLLEEEIYFNTTRTYEPVNIGPGRHIIDLTVENDRMYGNKRHHTYEMTLREGYERYIGEDTEQQIPDNVEVHNYTTLDINPMKNDVTSHLRFDVRRSEAGEVEILVDPEHEVGDRIHDKGEGEWVIKEGTDVMFRAEYTPVTSRAISYRWTWDGESEVGEDLTDFSYEFSEEIDGELEVKVEESSGIEIYDTISITVDRDGPRPSPDAPYIVVNDENISLGETAHVNETEEVEFSGKFFEDVATGVVDLYRWNFSDESEIQEGENVTHTFDVPGEYEVNLNVTDAIGNWNDDPSINVKVWDITEPEGDFSIEWNDSVSREPTVRLQRDTDVTFNATDIIAHPEEYEGSDLNYTWTLIGEEENVTNEQDIWTFDEFDEVGEYTIQLNVTDEPSEYSRGNYRIIEKTIIIERGPVPDLMVHDLEFSEEDIRVGDTVMISVNVTNVGDLNAEAIETILRVNEDIVDIDETFYQNGDELNITEIAQGETVTIRFEWEPETEGENTVNVNVTDEEEPEDLWYDNDIEETINVDAPVWRQYVVYALIPIIIIGVTVGLYLYKDKLGEILR